MRVIIQRVTRASVEACGVVESRIGLGAVVTLSVGRGDTAQSARNIASKVLALKLWPELVDPDTACCSNVVENGFEVMTMLQQSLNADFEDLVPDLAECPGQEAAKAIYDAFVAQLREEYQEEMVVSVPPEEDNAGALRLELASGPAFYQVGVASVGAQGAKVSAGAAARGAAAPAAEKAEAGAPALTVVTKALQRLPKMSKGKPLAEADRLLRILRLPKFRAAFAEAEAEQMDEFAEALVVAARVFTQKQQKEISELTGLQVASKDYAPGDDGADEGDAGANGAQGDEDDLSKQLAELNEEVLDPRKGIALAKKRRAGEVAGSQKAKVEEEAAGARVRPDASGKAAPDTPAAMSARQWAANRGLRARLGTQHPANAGAESGFMQKGGGKGKWRGPVTHVGGIATVGESARLHGTTPASALHAQRVLAAANKGGPAQAAEPHNKRRAVQLPKGTPTVAPMCPAPAADEEEL